MAVNSRDPSILKSSRFARSVERSRLRLLLLGLLGGITLWEAFLVGMAGVLGLGFRGAVVCVESSSSTHRSYRCIGTLLLII